MQKTVEYERIMVQDNFEYFKSNNIKKQRTFAKDINYPCTVNLNSLIQNTSMMIMAHNFLTEYVHYQNTIHTHVNYQY